MVANLIQNNLNGNDAVMFTLKKMRELVNEYKIKPEIREWTNYIHTIFNNTTDGRDFKKVFENIYNFVKTYIRYQKDIEGVETLQSPFQTLRLQMGDCDDQSILIATLLEASGYPSRFSVVSNRPDKIFTHVFAEGYTPTMQWIILDTVEDVFGAEYTKPITALYSEGV